MFSSILPKITYLTLVRKVYDYTTDLKIFLITLITNLSSNSIVKCSSSVVLFLCEVY